MRIVKFRAWDWGSSKMEYSENPPSFSFWKYVAYDSNCLETLMQYTGLNDKNGKEIYEGDILTVNVYPYIDEGKQNYVGVVEWIFAGFRTVLKCVNKDKRGISDGINEPLEEGEDFEVIGNVHENPEILEKK